MRKFKSQGQAQRFLSCHGVVNNLFRLDGHLMKASNYRVFRDGLKKSLRLQRKLFYLANVSPNHNKFQLL